MTIVRAGSKRPRLRQAAEKRDELASFQLIELHSVPPKRDSGGRRQASMPFRSTPKADVNSRHQSPAQRATSRLMHRSKQHRHSISSSARASSVGGHVAADPMNSGRR
jgi:hypothetical protein